MPHLFIHSPVTKLWVVSSVYTVTNKAAVYTHVQVLVGYIPLFILGKYLGV